MSRLSRRLRNPDIVALLTLIILWWVFFWRLFTPLTADQASLKQGDFSGQFVAFGGYQYARFADGEIPLWNPYNNGGLPFVADTQAAVFYPPRLLTIILSVVVGEWSYNALQLEMTFHVLLYSFMMYAFIRRLTKGQPGSVYGSFVAAIVASYGGFLSGYPPLQLAMLEASVWLPLATLGILEATRYERLNWRWLLLTGFALGISWMAGHPQTSWFLTYLLLAYFAYRVYVQRFGWKRLISGILLFGAVSVGITAVTLLPGIEYLLLASRSGLGFDAKGNGFPFQDVAQFLYPGIVSEFSPLYVGIPALILVFIAIWYGRKHSIFWLGVFIIALIHSFGANSAFYHAIYNFLPGLRFFRGQERAAFLVANSLAILAGIGATTLFAWKYEYDPLALKRSVRAIALLCIAVVLLVFVGWLYNSEALGTAIGVVFFSTMIVVLSYLLFSWVTSQPGKLLPLLLLVALLVFELFSVNQDAESNYDSVPPTEQLALAPPAHVLPILEDQEGLPFRVDGFRGLEDNYGSLYRVMDIRGISPLFLASTQRIIYRNYVNNRLAWELFAVKYIYSERGEFTFDTKVVTTGTDHQGNYTLHRIADPRPFALLLYDVAVVDSDEFALALLDDPRFDPRKTAILHHPPSNIHLSERPPEQHFANVTEYSPESFTIEVETETDAILSVAHPDYPGWQATMDDNPIDILRAYGALMAVEVPAGKHLIQFTYAPISYQLGAILSLTTWLGILLLSILFLTNSLSRPITGTR